MNYNEAVESSLSMDLVPPAQHRSTFIKIIKAMDLSVISSADPMDNSAMVLADKYNTPKFMEIAQRIQKAEAIAPSYPPIPLPPKEYADCSCIGEILQASKYEAIKSIGWQEYDEKISTFVNVSWQRKKSMRIAIPVLFAGALLVEDYKALYITCVEAYCRSKNTDVHSEHYLGAESNQSHPEEIQYNEPSIYNDVCIKATCDYDTTQIKIGLRTANLLVVGCVRVDVEEKANLGLTNEFFKPSNSTRLFFDTRSIQKAEQLIKEEKVEISDGYDYARLRQLRSKFDHESTYFMCRAAADGFLPYKNWPVTIWTYADVNTKKISQAPQK